jgi:hypothetical protein
MEKKSLHYNYSDNENNSDYENDNNNENNSDHENDNDIENKNDNDNDNENDKNNDDKTQDNEINSQDILDAFDLNKINQVLNKKRGRPKKKELILSSNSKIKSTSNKEIYNLEEEEEIILHLPLSKTELSKIDTDNINVEDILKNNNLSLSSDNINDSSTSEKESKNNSDNILSNIIDNNQYVKQLCLSIKKLKDENTELKKYLTEITPMYFTEVKVYPIELNLFDNKQNKLIPTTTNLCCWWCTCQFYNLPCYLPEKYYENSFYVSGCFCSFNCAGAYNLSLGDDKLLNRYSLLKLMYYMINKNKINSISDVEINIAGPRELLNKFGGPMTIEEYRKNSKILGREYHKLIPPFIPVNSGFEEITNSKNNSGIPNLSSIMNSNKNSDNIIKRTKPLNNNVSKQIDFFV